MEIKVNEPGTIFTVYKTWAILSTKQNIRSQEYEAFESLNPYYPGFKYILSVCWGHSVHIFLENTKKKKRSSSYTWKHGINTDN